ncbi:MAG: GTP 3',8-cyclase MoaA [Candidatus Marinimicrobia bacterium]|nr:GTP 3',8-cyclase MoaA [Candidatus Neomarinimicrobiota bacterium]MCF7829297.1 GTP 3',8-cyclase MoaA [Candidatus Neomarinimicrobiota bacterium]MCF7880041.1 GTP 3',8-cyclase MoaA [Candidatus Neomarinimicrobiota bacterium]
MPSPLRDNFGRRMDYLRLAVTDRCNLRCQYCMPAQGMEFAHRSEVLSWDEMERLCRIFVDSGVRKIRITGGEPFARQGLTGFLARLQGFRNQPDTGITTNGTLLTHHLEQLQSIDVTSLNVSLDSLLPETFAKITRRTDFEQTLGAIHEAYDRGFRLKINMVVLPGVNDHEIPDFVRLTTDKDITVRFIEPMPFNGEDISALEPMTGDEILDKILQEFPLRNLGENSSKVASLYQVPDYAGKIGIIYGYSRSFCDSCSRIRVSATGQLRTCLYGSNVLDLRNMLRVGSSDIQIREAIREALQNRYKSGVEAEAANTLNQYESMSTIGG